MVCRGKREWRWGWSKALFTHQETLCAKTVVLGKVMNTLNTLNIIGARQLYHGDFNLFFNIWSGFWLRGCTVLQQFYSLRSKIGQFLKAKGLLLRKLSGPLCLANLVFSVDLTTHLHTQKKPSRQRAAGAPLVCAHESHMFEMQLWSFHAAHFYTQLPSWWMQKWRSLCI